MRREEDVREACVNLSDLSNLSRECTSQDMLLELDDDHPDVDLNQDLVSIDDLHSRKESPLFETKRALILNWSLL